jgi:hypothetical protein
MRSIIKKFVTTITAIALLMAPSAVLLPSVAHADIRDNVCRGVNTTNGVADDTNCEETNGSTFADLMKKIINIFSIVVGSVSVIMIIIGGFRYIISGGDSGGVTAGKNTILYAIVGLVIVLFSQVIVRFVLTNTATS